MKDLDLYIGTTKNKDPKRVGRMTGPKPRQGTTPNLFVIEFKLSLLRQNYIHSQNTKNACNLCQT